ncbi:hypothetical protein [Paractinoplanes atraurantiacus]|uniref:Uncharacterized protein n=1 Tax=Paractinoplanes atraurantiacus TaxID=1036182 RepID=A0A285IG35_9ACTN|nr:hypothetical protein [Actinoplanes atraurantiacus]SNY46960.1 hypothetical protein SAMN05421748_10843 [Actinoplanes atraurantiacus]
MRRALVVFGALVMAYGLTGAARDPDRLGILVFLAAVLVLHDTVFLPLVLAAGTLIGRVVPAAGQPTARAAAVVGLAVAVVAVPLAIGPLDGPYLWGLLVILAVIAAGRKGIERWRSGRRGRSRG